MKRIEEEIKNHLKLQEIPELDKQSEEKCKELVLKNKRPTRARLWKRFSLFAGASVCLLICLLIPLFLRNPNPSNEKFYTDNESLKTPMSENEFNLFIQDNFSQYSFLTTDFDYESIIAFYTPDSEELLAVSLIATENKETFTSIRIYLVINKNFNLTENNIYIDNSSYIQTSDYELYKKTQTNVYDDYLYAYVIFHKYKLYINFDCVDETLLARFL